MPENFTALKPQVYTAFGRKMRELRGERRSQAEMAAFLEVTQAAYSQWELGKRCPKAEGLVRISRKVGCSIDWLLGEDKRPAPEAVDMAEKLAMLKAQADKAAASMSEVMRGITALEAKV